MSGDDNKRSPQKPSGITGPFSVGENGLQHHKITFPKSKIEIENMIGRLFTSNAGRMPIGLAPFSELKRNEEDDLDFTVMTRAGPRLLELAEFAPLDSLKVSYEQAPRQMSVAQTAELCCQLIQRKSKHQGGLNRLLLLYKTHAAFYIVPPAQELIRRKLCQSPPQFDAVYFLSPHDQNHASVVEIWPGSAHPSFLAYDDEALSKVRLMRIYPDELENG